MVAASMVHGAQKTKKKKHNVESLARPDSQPKQRLDCQYLFGKKWKRNVRSSTQMLRPKISSLATLTYIGLIRVQ